MKHKKLGYAKYGYLFSIPFVIAFLLFSLYPILYTAVIGFTDLKGLGMTSFHFLTDDPFRNFKAVLTNPSFIKALKNTVVLWLFNFVPQILLALLLTAWFTDKRSKVKGQGIFKVLFYMPNIITAATVAILFNSLFGYPMGPVNDLLMKLGFTDSPIYFLVNKTVARGVIIFIQTWMWYGYTMVILISGVLGISPEIFEAAEVDGAGPVRKLFAVTLPGIRGTILFALVMLTIGGFNVFTSVKMITGGEPAHRTDVVLTWMYYKAFSAGKFGYSAALSFLITLALAVLAVIQFRLMQKKDR